MLPSARRNVDV